MAFLEDAFKNGASGGVAAGLGVGIGLAVVGPLVFPLMRGLAKTVVRTGLVAYDQGRAMVDDVTAEGGLISEARQELAASRRTAGERRSGRRAATSEPATAPRS